MKKLWPILVLAIAAASCDKVEKPLKDGYGFVDLPETGKVVLIEEFTGTSCTFCPNGARKIEGYIKAAPNSVVAVAIHASFFATPNTKFPYDFRTDGGEELYNFMKSADPPAGLPGGMFDRYGFPDEVFNNPAKWDAILQERLADTAVISFTGSFEYNQNDSTFLLETDATVLADLGPDPLNIVAYLVEDSIVAPQLDNNVTVKDYVHNHVFRSSFSGMEGDQVSSGGASKDQVFSKNFELSLNKPGLTVERVEKCSAVFFIYNTNTQEVLQAHHAKFK